MKAGVLIGSFLALAALLGCSKEGKLIVSNNCKTEFTGSIENEEMKIAPGDKFTKDIYIGKKALIVGPDEIEIEVSGYAMTKKAFNTTVTVKSDETSEYDISDDVGAITLLNAHSLQINRISTKLCDSTQFGENLLSLHQALSPGTSRLIQLEEGCWDILVLYGREDIPDTIASIPVNVGQIISISWIPGYSYVP